jgi:hypothetical protein
MVKIARQVGAFWIEPTDRLISAAHRVIGQETDSGRRSNISSINAFVFGRTDRFLRDG